MSDLLIENLLPPQQWSWEVLSQRQHQNKNNPFLSSIGAYLDIGDDVVLKFDVRVSVPNVKCNAGRIVAVAKQTDLLATNIQFSSHPNVFHPNSMWVQLNLWFGGLFQNYIPPPSLSHVSLPPEMVRSYFVLWVPSSFIKDVAFIFHHRDIISGRYSNTKGVKNAYFCRHIWDGQTPLSNISAHPYYSIFLSNRCVESYGERVWGVIERIQEVMLKLMSNKALNQKLNQRVRIHMSNRDWQLFKSRFDQSSYCWFERTGSATVHRYGNLLCQETIPSKQARKEYLLIENESMFDQFVDAFGVCVVSTVRKRFPTVKSTPPVSNLTSVDVLNSLICLKKVSTLNSEIEYKHRTSERGIIFRYEYHTSKLYIHVRYEKCDSTEREVFDFYGVHLQPIVAPARTQNEQHPSVQQSFEAFECIFEVIAVHENEARCKVVDDNDILDTIYVLDSEHTFQTTFVIDKINEYLINN